MRNEITTKSNTFATPQNMEQAIKLAEIISKSDMVPKDYKGKPGNCLVAMQMGAELGLPPMQALQNIAVVNGRPAVWGDALIGLVRGSGLCEYVDEDFVYDDKGAVVAATCTSKRKGEPKQQSRTFSIEMAKQAGLWGRNTWSQYPARMLQMRARSWLLRDMYADVLKGLSVAEEAMDIPQPVEVLPADTPKPTSTVERVMAKIKHDKPAEVDTTQDVANPNIDDLILEMAKATTINELKIVASKAVSLESSADKQRARECYKERMQELKDMSKQEE